MSAFTEPDPAVRSRTLASVLASTVLVLLAASPGQAAHVPTCVADASGRCGDVFPLDGPPWDDTLSLSDVIVTLDFFLGALTPNGLQVQRADLHPGSMDGSTWIPSGNCEITLSDVVVVLDAFLGSLQVDCGSGFEQVGTTDAEGKVIFVDTETGEEVIVSAKTEGGDPIEGVDVFFVDGEGHEVFVGEDDSEVHSARLAVFPHNSEQLLTLFDAGNQVGPTHVEPGSETGMALADFEADNAGAFTPLGCDTLEDISGVTSEDLWIAHLSSSSLVLLFDSAADGRRVAAALSEYDFGVDCYRHDVFPLGGDVSTVIRRLIPNVTCDLSGTWTVTTADEVDCPEEFDEFEQFTIDMRQVGGVLSGTDCYQEGDVFFTRTADLFVQCGDPHQVSGSLTVCYSTTASCDGPFEEPCEVYGVTAMASGSSVSGAFVAAFTRTCADASTLMPSGIFTATITP